jgi:hypothetical protein
MSVRKRKWTTRNGQEREAWVVDYKLQNGDRCIETFSRQKDADARHAQVRVDVRAGVHVAPSKSIMVKEAVRRVRNCFHPPRPSVSGTRPRRSTDRVWRQEIGPRPVCARIFLAPAESQRSGAFFCCLGSEPEATMDTTTLLIIILVLFLLFGGGWYGRGRWY